VTLSANRSAPGVIERYLRSVKGRASLPIRTWRNRIGPGDASLIHTAIASMSGARTISAIAETTRSNIVLARILRFIRLDLMSSARPLRRRGRA
jgi:hypothetical protein